MTVDIAELQKEVDYWHELSNSYEQTIVRLTEAISEQPDRKKGRWKQWEEYGFEETYECTVCRTPFVLIDGTPMDNEYYFCPHCGACMTEERESEQK